MRDGVMRRIFHPDRLALLLSLLGVIFSYLVAEFVFERLPHIEDEAAYVWQARVYAGGHLTLPTPPHAKSVLVPFVVDYNGQRFSKYPPGWSLVLAVGMKLGFQAWINPLLAGLGVWLTYLLGKRIFNPVVGLLSAGLCVTSPFFLMNSGSLLSHPLGLVLSASFALVWMMLFDHSHTASTNRPQSSISDQQPAISNRRSTILLLTAGISLGMLILTRPYTAVAVAVPFGLHGLILLIRGDWSTRRYVLGVGGMVLAFTVLYFAWQYAVTGEPFKNPYELWWPYDKIGFGKGVGILERGHNFHQAITNTRQSLTSGFFTLFGWGAFSWIFIPIGLWAATFGGDLSNHPRLSRSLGVPSNSVKTPRSLRVPHSLRVSRLFRTPRSLRTSVIWQAWMLAGAFTSLVVFYMLYWIGSDLYGPRYYYEGLFCLTLLSGVGIAYLAGWPMGDNHGDAVAGRRARKPLTSSRKPLTSSRKPLASSRKPLASSLALHGNSDVKSMGITPLSEDAAVRAPITWRMILVGLMVIGLVAYNLAVYLPKRLEVMHGLYGSNRDIVRNFQSAKVLGIESPLQPALIIVHSEKWQFYGTLMELQDPFFTTPFVFAWSSKPTVDAILHNDFPTRTVYHYYEDDPGVLYNRPSEKNSATGN